MALDAQHRSSIYRKLVPILGEDDANALMTEIPATDGAELVTKDFLRAELAERINRQTVWLAGLLMAATGIVLGAVGLTS